jgi:hypothetical protein
MGLMRWFYNETGIGSPPADLVYYVLRGGMFVLSFVLEDWAIYELVSTPRYRVPTVVLVASSYVTWTYQTHTFSNSLETLLVAWGLVLIQRIIDNKVKKAAYSGATPADTSAEAFGLLLMCCAVARGCHWRFQPHHIPCFSLDTWPTIAPAFRSQVSGSTILAMFI